MSKIAVSEKEKAQQIEEAKKKLAEKQKFVTTEDVENKKGLTFDDFELEHEL